MTIQQIGGVLALVSTLPPLAVLLWALFSEGEEQ
jgi:hypothetical protein